MSQQRHPLKMASKMGVEPMTYRLGGDRSIRLSYWGILNFMHTQYPKWTRTTCRLGGGCSILLSYGCICRYCNEKKAFCQCTFFCFRAYTGKISAGRRGAHGGKAGIRGCGRFHLRRPGVLSQ